MAKRKINNNLRYLKLLLFSNLANNFGFALFAPLYGAYIIDLGEQPAKGSYIWALYTLVTASLLLFFGKLENTSKNKLRMICIGNVFQLLGTVIILLNTNLQGLLAGLLVYGCGTAILGPSWYYLYSNHLSKKRGTEEWSWNTAGASFAVAGGSALGGVLITYQSFKGVLVCMTISCMVGLFSVFKLYRVNFGKAS